MRSCLEFVAEFATPSADFVPEVAQVLFIGLGVAQSDPGKI
jgi:hypothetical protein